MEMNGQLLDRLEPGFYSKNSPAIESAKIRIAEKVADERMNESTRHREQVDRFE
ncbi:hypothetical protein D3C75_1384910 [compost metagenome]